MPEVKAPLVQQLLSMHAIVRLQLIPWARTRRSVRRLFQKRTGLRYFAAGHGEGKRYYTTLAWVEAYKAKVRATK